MSKTPLHSALERFISDNRVNVSALSKKVGMTRQNLARNLQASDMKLSLCMKILDELDAHHLLIEIIPTGVLTSHLDQIRGEVKKGDFEKSVNERFESVGETMEILMTKIGKLEKSLSKIEKKQANS